MSQDAALLQQILSEKIGTDGLIQMGTTQPYDLIRLYENPANATKLTNIGTDGLTTASTTVLVIDEGSARTGLTFEPDLSLLKHTGSDVKLLVSASVEQAVNVVLNHAGHTTTQLVTAPADKTAVLTIGLIAGIATIIGSHNFFKLAASGEDSGGGAFMTNLVNCTYNAGTLEYTSGDLAPGIPGYSAQVAEPLGVAVTVPETGIVNLLLSASTDIFPVITDQSGCRLQISAEKISIRIDGGSEEMLLFNSSVDAGDVIDINFEHRRVYNRTKDAVATYAQSAAWPDLPPYVYVAQAANNLVPVTIGQIAPQT